MSAAAAAVISLKQTRMTILLSINAAAILVAGILIASALGLFDGKMDIVAAHSDVIEDEYATMDLIDAGTDSKGDNFYGSAGGSGGSSTAPAAPNSTTASGEKTDENGKATGGNVKNGELWNEKSMTIYQTADRDVCIDDSLPGYTNMYWQTSNKEVIAGFYNKARTELGFSASKCRYPLIKGVGTTTVTAGTYDGSRRDTINVIVSAVPVDEWKQQVLKLVNEERKKAGVAPVSWGSNCEQAATIRASEIQTQYSHTRPDGSDWSTACPTPKGQYSGENLAAGANAASPKAVMASWMSSDTHRKNILNANFRHLSVGFKFNPNDKYKTYWTQIFTSW